MGALEVGVNPASVFRPGNEPARRADERASWTCAISIGTKGAGTGLLVNRDLVLTNYHVIAPLLRDPQLFRSSRCRFDFMEDPETGEQHEGISVAFAENWEGPWSPFSEVDESGADTGFDPDKLDYALIRLAEPIGLQPVDRGTYQRSTRGWLPLPSDPALPQVGAGLSIWQHPAVPESMLTSKLVVMPMKWDGGVVLSVLDGGLRLRHNVKTLHGSSGAACFDANLDLVALHHSGDPNLDANKLGKWNQAVPMRSIIAHLRREHADLIGVVPPPPVRLVPAAPVVSQTSQESNIIEDRINAATILMDRDNDEEGIAWARDKLNGPPGIVHVLTGRHIDSHRSFLERMTRLSLAAQEEGLEARQRRERAFLTNPAEAISGEVWQPYSVTWRSGSETPERALQFMRREFDNIAASPGRTVVDVAVNVAEANLSRDKKLVPALAAYCASISSADRMQVFIVYYDLQATPGNDKTRERRKAFAQLWKPENRPPGCGVCLQLADIDSFALGGWFRSVQALWQGKTDTLTSAVEGVFSSGKLPMLEAERKIAPILRSNMTGSV